MQSVGIDRKWLRSPPHSTTYPGCSVKVLYFSIHSYRRCLAQSLSTVVSGTQVAKICVIRAPMEGREFSVFVETNVREWKRLCISGVSPAISSSSGPPRYFRWVNSRTPLKRHRIPPDLVGNLSSWAPMTFPEPVARLIFGSPRSFVPGPFPGAPWGGSTQT